jgi:hypothetical protein
MGDFVATAEVITMGENQSVVQVIGLRIFKRR